MPAKGAAPARGAVPARNTVLANYAKEPFLSQMRNAVDEWNARLICDPKSQKWKIKIDGKDLSLKAYAGRVEILFETLRHRVGPNPKIQADSQVRFII